METVNCIRCDFRHKDNGNCTAVGGFCLYRFWHSVFLTREEAEKALEAVKDE